MKPLPLLILLLLLNLALLLAQEQCTSTDPDTCTDPSTASLSSSDIDPCHDIDEECPGWAMQGECRANPNYMTDNCPKSCGICKPLRFSPSAAAVVAEDSGEEDAGNVCRDDNEECARYAAEGECLINPAYMKDNCKYSCWICVNAEKDKALGVDDEIIAKKELYAEMKLGRHQLIRDVNDEDDDAKEDPMTAHDHTKVRATIHEMEIYARLVMTSPNIHVKARERCRNEFRMCAEWASRGYCFPSGHPSQILDKDAQNGTNGGKAKDVLFMMNMCPLACKTCEEIPSLACAGKRHPYSKPLMEKSGGLNTYFESLRKADRRAVFVSYPDAGVEGHEDDSYVVVLPDFISEKEADAMISLGKITGFSSADSAPCRGHTACTAYRVEADVIYKDVMERIATLANTTLDYLEPMEILRQKALPNQSYNGHKHNYELSGVWKPVGPRVLTFLLFLSDHNSKRQMGFPYLDWLFLQPKKGTVAVWPNVINEDVLEMDPLTSYEFFGTFDEETKDDEMYVANVHVRLHNWTDASYRDCA